MCIRDRQIPTLNIKPEHNEVGGPDVSGPEFDNFTSVLNSKNIPNKFVLMAGADHGFSHPGEWQKVADETDAYYKASR